MPDQKIDDMDPEERTRVLRRDVRRARFMLRLWVCFLIILITAGYFWFYYVVVQ